MNKERRKRISEIISEIEDIKAKLEDVKMDEEIAFDCMPENLQGSTRGEEMEEAMESMSDALEHLDEAIESLEEIT